LSVRPSLRWSLTLELEDDFVSQHIWNVSRNCAKR